MQALAAPDPEQLVSGAVNMLAKAPSTAFSLADLLAALCRQNNKENSPVVVQRLVEILKQQTDGVGSSDSADETAAALLAPAHLLALLTTSDPSLVMAVKKIG